MIISNRRTTGTWEERATIYPNLFGYINKDGWKLDSWIGSLHTEWVLTNPQGEKVVSTPRFGPDHITEAQDWATIYIVKAKSAHLYDEYDYDGYDDYCDDDYYDLY